MLSNKDDVKFNLSIDEIADLVAELGGEPIMKGDLFTAKTICHCGESHKLYYYDNTHLFRCYSGCADDTFDIFQLVMKVKHIELPSAINFVCSYFGFHTFDYEDEGLRLEDWEYLKKKEKQKPESKEAESKLTIIDSSVIRYFPTVHISSWEAEGISFEVEKECGIKYDPINHGIIVPHYDIDGNLVGIRERTLIKEEEVYGKYRPAIFHGIQYNHPLGFNLYNLNNSKNNISLAKMAIVFEGEKSTLKYRSMFSPENDISVACCGSSLIGYQVNLLKQCGAREIVVAFDRQFQEPHDEEYNQWTKKLTSIYNKYGASIQISFIFDNDNLLGYKDAPIDKGKEIFLDMFEKRIRL